MSILFSDFHEAYRSGNGPLLATCLAPNNSVSDPTRLWSFSQLSNYQTIEADIRYHVVQDRNAVKLPKQEANQWIQIFVSLWKCIRELDLIQSGHGGDWNTAFKAYREVCINLNRGYQSAGFQFWTIPCMYTAGKYLRAIAIKADVDAANAAANSNGFTNGLQEDIADEGEKNERLTDAARVLQQMLSVCRTDDSELQVSRKWGVISLANLLFKTYFKLNNLALTKHVIAVLDAPNSNLPPLSSFPSAQVCTYSYYRGVLEFLKDNYSGAEHHLDQALRVCHRDAVSNREQILTYLIPAHILNSQQLPTQALLAQMPTLEKSLLHLCKAIKEGNLSSFDQALADAEVELVNRRIYLTLERSRDLCLRNLFRKVFTNAGWDETKDPQTGEVTARTRRTRLKLAEFETAVRVAYRNSTEPVVVEKEEVECFVANMIYKGYMKGYIAREQTMVVLSKKGDAFVGTGV